MKTSSTRSNEKLLSVAPSEIALVKLTENIFKMVFSYYIRYSIYSIHKSFVSLFRNR